MSSSIVRIEIQHGRLVAVGTNNETTDMSELIAELGLSPDGLNTILSGSGAPDPEIGHANDFYVDTVGLAIYGPKDQTWPAPVSLVGPPGPQGPQGMPGQTVYGQNGQPRFAGAGEPPVTIIGANPGDYYLDTGRAELGDVRPGLR